MSTSLGGRISASIVVYKTSASQIDTVLKCLERSNQIEVLYVVDNSPTDELKVCFGLPWIQYLHLGQNLGYGSAHNIAIRQAIDYFDLHLVLNPDIYFEADQLRKAIERARQDSRIGQLMPKVLNADGSIQYLCKLLPTPWDLIIRRFPPLIFKQYFKSKIDCYELKATEYQYEMNVPNLSGCFMLLSCKALKEVGLFDERYFMYGEDVDLTRRIHRQFVTLFYPGAVITHLHNRESYSSLKMLWIHGVNLSRYFSKWGWFWDSERERDNSRLLESLK